MDKLAFDDEGMGEYAALGADPEAVRQVWRMFDEALGGEKAEAGEGKQYSIQTDADGRAYVEVDTDQHLFDGLSVDEQRHVAEKIIRKRFAGKVYPIGDDKAFVNGKSADEYAYSAARRISSEEKSAKFKASTEYDNLLAVSQRIPDGEYKNPKDNGDPHWRYYETLFGFGSVRFSGIVNVKPTEKGWLAYDITHIKDVSIRPSGSRGKATSSSTNADTSSIPNRTENVNKNYSLRSTDTQGRDLTEAQTAFFSESKARDASGQLLPLYHGTENTGFTTFKQRGNRGYFFTDSQPLAKVYSGRVDQTFAPGKQDASLFEQEAIAAYTGSAEPMEPERGGIYEAYLNLTNPLELDAKGAEWDKVSGKAKGDAEEQTLTTDEWVERAYEQGYDGLIIRDVQDGNDERNSVYVAFEPGQIKSVNNTEPTNDPDIRYSLKTDLIHNRDEVTDLDSKALADAALADIGSRHNRRAFEGEVGDVLTYLSEDADPDMDAAMRTLTETCKAALEKANTIDTDHADYVSAAKDYLKTTRIKLTDAQKADAESVFGSYGAFRKQIFGGVKIANDGLTLDAAWAELTALNPRLFPADTNEADMPALLAAAVNAMKTRYVNNFATDIDTAAADMAQKLVNDAFGLGGGPGDGQKERQDSYALTTLRVSEANRAPRTAEGSAGAKPATLPSAARAATNGGTGVESRTLAVRDAYLGRYGETPKGESGRHGTAPPTGGNGFTPTGAVPNGKLGESQFAVKTGPNSEALSDKVKQMLRDNPFYRKTSQRDNLEQAIANIEAEGFTARVNKLLTGQINAVTPYGQVEAFALAKIAKAKGDVESEAAIAFRVKDSGTQLGQAMAMRRMYLEMTPEGKERFVQRVVDQINQQYTDKGKKTRVVMPEGLAAKLAEAGDNEAAVNAVLDAAYKEIARQMPHTVGDTTRTWRYLAMLGNPMTHIKNIASNAAFAPMVAMKNKLAAGMEAAFIHGDGERTKSGAPIQKKYRDYAKAVTRKQRAALLGESKHNDGKGKINDYRQKAPKAIDRLSKWNADLLSSEDLLFKNVYFENALGSYLQANKIDIDNIDQGDYYRAVDYAMEEAYKNTLNNVNKFAAWVNKATRSENAVEKIAAGAINTVIPFKNTPANLISRGVEYSPAGLLWSLTANTVKLARGRDFMNGGAPYTINQYLDSLNAGIVGTVGNAGLGMLLAAIGVLKVSEDDRDELTGKQKNSLTLFGYEIGLDWAGAAAMSIIMGGRMYEELTTDGFQFADIMNVWPAIADPVMDLSMMQGIKGLIKSSGYSEDPISEGAKRIGTSFLSQFVPSIFGAIARTVDDTRRTVYTDKNSSLDSNTQYFLQSVRNKLPGLSQGSLPYMDVWGNGESNGTVAERLISNFGIPGYPGKVKTVDDVEKVLLDLYDTYGNKEALPTKASKMLTANGEPYPLNQQEYEQFAKRRGELAHAAFEGVFGSEAFRNADGEYQLDAVGFVWKYATQTAAHEINDGVKVDSWVSGIGSDPAGKIVKKMQENIKSGEKDKFQSSFFDALEEGDVQSMRMCVAGLMENGKKRSDIKTSVTGACKEKYREMHLAGDEEGKRLMKEALMEAGLGYTGNEFTKWAVSEEEE